MMPLMWLIGGWLLFAVLTWLIRRPNLDVDVDGKPTELGGAKLLWAEHKFRTEHPTRLVARVDRVYWHRGAAMLVELKSRELPLAFASDVIELSVQRLTITYSTGLPVADYAYVVIRIPNGGKQVMRRVMLMPEEKVLALAKRRASIVQGAVEPEFARSQGLCRKCAFRSECRPDL